MSTTFKLLDSFEGLLDREIIQADLERKHMDLLRAYGTDLKEARAPLSALRAPLTLCLPALRRHRACMRLLHGAA